MASTERTTLGRYHLKQMLGKGGMGAVYEAFDPQLSRKVAIKTIRQDLLDDRDTEYRVRFVREARAAATLNHPNIVTVFDTGEEEDILYIVMELVHGPNLKQRMSTEPPLNLRAVIDIALNVCEGLHHAHEHGLVHRDMKPANVLLGTDLVKIMDFGVALKLGSTITSGAALIGTPQYMSPEQYESPKVDRRSDIFSTGIILYEILTGLHPFGGGTPAAIMRRVLSAEPPPATSYRANVPEVLSEVVLRALAKRPADRYQTAREFAEALRQVSQTAPPEHLEDTFVPSSVPKTVRMEASPFEQAIPPLHATPGLHGSPLPELTDSDAADHPHALLPILAVIGLLTLAAMAFALLII